MNTIQQAVSQFTQTQIATASLSRVIGVSAALLMGLFIVFAVGFASPDVIHNAAHDLRHGLSFPCH